MSYADKLRDARWQRKRLEVLELAGWICQECGAEDHRALDVHHSYYQRGLEPWEHPTTAMRCVCNPCHEIRAESERRLLRALSIYNATELAYLAKAFEYNDHGFAFPVAVLALSKDSEAVSALFLNFQTRHVAISYRYLVPEEVLA